ncbi:MAG: DegV family protein [Erysipelotrichaceae bacterium]|jgi:DegV family protein with EDD domain|nr:DegV family protein [Erysipelotrichaceae bacterium]
MRKVKLIIDSTADMLPEDYLKYDVEIVHLYVILNGVEKKSVEVTPEVLFKYVEETKKLPKTAAISSETIKEVFVKFLDQDYDIVFISIGKQMSGTYNSARLAAEQLDPTRVHVVSSEVVSSGTALLIEKAAKLRDAGKGAKEIADILTATAPKVVCQFIIDTLDYLYMGGRVSSLGRFLGQAFRIHPYIRCKDGKLEVFKKPMGKLSKCYQEMVSQFKKELPNIETDVIYVTHCMGEKEDVDMIVNEVKSVVDPSIVKITTAGSVISSHCGPRTIGILYILKN